MTIKRAPYEGHKHKLIVAFDVGTTFSGVSYSILDHGSIPEISHVHRFPGQAKPGPDSKIPSIMYYDQRGKVCAIGEEADGDSVEEKAEEHNWIKLEWFKMHYRPKKSSNPLPTTIKVPPLPPNKSIVDVLADFLTYLNECTKQYIEDSLPGIGTRVCRDPNSKIEYILSHPNRWEGPPQGLMRQAAEKAGLITPGGINEVTFISEGEASINMCIEHDLLSDSIRKGDGVIVVDAGGGTIDFSAYALDKKSSSGKVFQEIVEPQSHFMGSEFVTERLGDHLKKLLKGSKYQDDIPNMKKVFNKKTKCTFRNINDPYYIHFGSLRDSDPKFKIIKGKLRLEGKTIASFINPFIDCIVDTVCEMRRNSSTSISTVFLVGGFANNDYLFKEVKNSLSTYGLTINRPGAGTKTPRGTSLNKAVSEGAVIYALDNPVRSRVMYRAYGVECNILYDPKFFDHVQRKSQCITLHSGRKAIPKGFHLLVSKREQLGETQELTCQYVRSAQYMSELKEIRKEVFCYQGNLPRDEYKWMDNDPSGFQRYFTVKADLSNVPITSSSNGGRSRHYRIEVNIILLLGGTEPKAQIAWKDSRGQERRQDAEIIYDVDEVKGANNTSSLNNASPEFSWNVVGKKKSPNQFSSSIPMSPSSTSTSTDFPPFTPTTATDYQTGNPFALLSSDWNSSGTDGILDLDESELWGSEVESSAGSGWNWDRRPSFGISTTSDAPPTGVPIFKGGRKTLGKRVF